MSLRSECSFDTENRSSQLNERLLGSKSCAKFELLQRSWSFKLTDNILKVLAGEVMNLT